MRVFPKPRPASTNQFVHSRPTGSNCEGRAQNSQSCRRTSCSSSERLSRIFLRWSFGSVRNFSAQEFVDKFLSDTGSVYCHLEALAFRIRYADLLNGSSVASVSQILMNVK